MSRHQPLKEFSVERRMRQRRLGDGSTVDPAEALEAINRLDGEMAALRETCAAEPETPKVVANGYPLEPRDALEARIQIEKIVGKIAGLHDEDADLVAMTDRVADEVVKIIEAFSFQDITGQRINKVVKTIRFIEERILAMIDIWGAEAFADLPISREPNDQGDAGLMNGPQLANQGVSQDDINALFV